MRFDVVTPQGTLLSREVDELVAPGVLGELGVLAGHLPLITATRYGVVRYQHSTTHGTLAVGPGVLEVAPGERVVLLAQSGVIAQDIDVHAVRGELESAERDLAAWDGTDAAAREQIEHRIAWAQARLDATGAATPRAAH